jgi:hypothetical protein
MYGAPLPAIAKDDHFQQLALAGSHPDCVCDRSVKGNPWADKRLDAGCMEVLYPSRPSGIAS